MTEENLVDEAALATNAEEQQKKTTRDTGGIMKSVGFPKPSEHR